MYKKSKPQIVDCDGKKNLMNFFPSNHLGLERDFGLFSDFRNSSVMQSLSNDPGTAVNPTEQSSIQQDGHEDGQQLISPQYATGTAGVSVLDMQSLHYRSRVGLNE